MKSLLLTLLAGLGLVGSALAQTIDWTATDEELVGPFASWRNLKTDFGAVGDGIAEDTAAFQGALNAFRDMPNIASGVLYVPPGTYCITSTLTTVRSVHQDYLGFEWIGDDPATTRLVWDGANGGTMVRLDQWFGKVSRLTFDGAGRAGIGLYREGQFSTYGEISDVFFQDMQRAVQFGGENNGQAETMINRCRFTRMSEFGVFMANFNSLDIWIWNSLFTDCARGGYCGAGNFHAFKNVFLRSTVADVGGTSFIYDFVDNVSIGSRRFLDWQTGFASPISISILARNNRIYDCTGDYAIYLNNIGPYYLFDNVIKNRPGDATSSVRLNNQSSLSLGNVTSVPDAFERRGLPRLLDNTVNPALTTPASVPLPRTPPRQNRLVFEAQPGTGDDAAAIQARIAQAAASGTPRPVVHIRKGIWNITRTLIVPAASDLQIIGDGASENSTALHWSGPPGGLVMRLEGPSRATLRDLSLNGASNADALLVLNADQPGGRLYAEQLLAAGIYQTYGNDANGGYLLTADGLDLALDAAGIYGTPPGAFPGLSYQNANYFRDVVFLPQGAGAPVTVHTTQAPEGSYTDDTAYEMGLRFRVSQPGVITALRHYRPAAEPGPHTGRLWTTTGTLLASIAFTAETASGWQQATLATPIPVTAGSSYVITVNCNAYYPYTGSGLADPIVNGPIQSQPPAPLDAFPADAFLRAPLAPLRASRIEWPLARPAGVTHVKLFRVNLGVTGIRTALRVTSGKGSPLELWRQLHFGTQLESPPAANGDSPAGDGVPNLLKYALRLDPFTTSANALPAPSVEGGLLALTYSKAKAATDITVTAEVSGDLVNWFSSTADVTQRWQVIDGTTFETITARDLTIVGPGCSAQIHALESHPAMKTDAAWTMVIPTQLRAKTTASNGAYPQTLFRGNPRTPRPSTL